MLACVRLTFREATVRFYVSCLASFPPPPPPRSRRRRLRLRLRLLDRECRMATSPSEPQLRAPDGSVPARPQLPARSRRTSAPTAMFSAGPQPPAPDGSVPCQTYNCQLPTAMFPAGPQPPAPNGSAPSKTSIAQRHCTPPPPAPDDSVLKINRQLATAVFPRRTSTVSRRYARKNVRKNVRRYARKNVSKNVGRYA